jgi:hypothetical protein
MSEQDPSEKFFETEPKLPDLYVMWLQLAQVAHKIEPFARGDRSPAAVNQAREARENIRIARQELTETELFIAAQTRDVDDRRERVLSAWEQEVDRPDLQVEYVQPELPVSEPGWPETDLPAAGQPRANADELVGHVRLMTNPAGLNCYNCGHPRGAHGEQSDPDIGPGCATIVEHGYPCDCPRYATGTARPVAEIHDQPASYGQLMEVCDDLELEDGTVRTEINQCADCGHGFQLHPIQGGQCTHVEIIGEPRMGEREHCLCLQYHPTYRFEFPGVERKDPNQCDHCGHGRDEHKFQGCVVYDPRKGNCACLQYVVKEAQTP